MKKIYLLGIPLFTLILAGCFHVKPVADAVKYNCEYSGGKFENGKCGCPKGENDKDVWTYEESSGYCLTPFGTPGGERGEELKKISESKFQESSTSQNTYKNAEFGFSFQYPINWVIQDAPEEDPYVAASLKLWVLAQAVPQNFGGEVLPPLHVAVYNSLYSRDFGNLGITSLKDYLEKYSKVVPPYGDPLYQGEIKEIRIGNNDGFTVKAGPNSFGGGEYFFTMLKNNAVLEIWQPKRFGDPEESIADDIITSFQFTK